jgi:hypothetical protein
MAMTRSATDWCKGLAKASESQYSSSALHMKIAEGVYYGPVPWVNGRR